MVLGGRKMPTVPLGLQTYKRRGLPEARMVNMYAEKDGSGISPDKLVRIQRPGLATAYNLTAPARGLHYRTSTQERLTVEGGRLFANSVDKGAIGGSGPTAIVSTPFLSLIASGGLLHRYDTAVASVALPNDAPLNGYVQDVDQLNGYGLVLIPNGRFYWIVPGETAIKALNFATAESLPDRAVAIRRLGDEFWTFGEQTVEVWQATGDQDLPFQRAVGRNFERGCLYRDAVRRFDNTLVWIGDDRNVYRAAGVPQVISDSGISERIGNATADCSAWTFGLEGHSFYVLRIPGEGVFAYDASSQGWSEFTWGATTGYQVGGDTIVAGDKSVLWRLAPSSSADDGVPFLRLVTGTLPTIGKPPRNDSASIGVSVSQDSTIRLRWRDGQYDYPDYYDELAASAPFDVATMYRLGSADEPYREYEVSSVDPARLVINGMVVNEAWG